MKQNELCHYGVKGMKWGVVRAAGKNAYEASREASNLASNISKNAKASKKTRRQMASMSDAELRSKISRMQMEQQYSSLNPSRVSRGASCAANILSVIGSVAAIGGSIAGIALAVHEFKK